MDRQQRQSPWINRLLAAYTLVTLIGLVLGNTGLVPWPVVFVLIAAVSLLAFAALEVLVRRSRRGRCLSGSGEVPEQWS